MVVRVIGKSGREWIGVGGRWPNVHGMRSVILSVVSSNVWSEETMLTGSTLRVVAKEAARREELATSTEWAI